MSFFEAIVLGLIQGITEFFPISSSGHLVIVEQLLGIEIEHEVLFHVMLHMGTLLAILLAFRKDIKRLWYSLVGIAHDLNMNFKIFMANHWKGQEKKYRKIFKTQYRKMAVMLLISSISTAIIGVVLRNLVDQFTHPLLIAGLGILVTGLLLYVAGFSERGNKTPKIASWTSAFTVGICQGISVIPGISRFGITLVSGLLHGFNRSFAWKYSVLTAIPAIIGAAVFELVCLPGSGVEITFGFIGCCLTGTIVAAIVGFFAIRGLLWIVKSGKLRIFSYYCLAVGILVIFLNYLV